MSRATQQRTSLLALLGTVALLTACNGVVIDGSNSYNATVGTLHLRMDAYGALQIEQCLGAKGTCTPLPNGFGCEELEIDIKRDASTHVRCWMDGKLVEDRIATVADGVPIVCKTNSDHTCQSCADIYGTLVLDTCNRGAQLFRSVGGGWGGQGQDGIPGVALVPGGSDTSPPGLDNGGGDNGDTPPSTPPPSGGNAQCDPKLSAKKYVDAFNQVLANDHAGFRYLPDLSLLDTKNGFFSGSGGTNICSTKVDHKDKCWGQGDRLQDKLQAMLYGKGKQGCFCTDNCEVCKCQRMTRSAMRTVCTYIQQLEAGGCTNGSEHKAALVMIYGAATKFLSGGTYSDGNFPPGSNVPPTIKPPKCLGSPLVLDTKGDGIKPTSLDQGVRFDLLGNGVQRTAWVRGDDALLVYDRNGNGRIDGGAELFGEGVFVDGLPAADGFEALAVLDRITHGGNGNGLIDSGDLLYGELRLWNDANGDGQAEASELRTLAEAGIRAIDLAHVDGGPQLDDHGNDLGMRGSFIKDDGSRGLMIDVNFALGR